MEEDGKDTHKTEENLRTGRRGERQATDHPRDGAHIAHVYVLYTLMNINLKPTQSVF